MCFSVLFALIFGFSILQEASWLSRDVLLPVKEIVNYAQIIEHREDFTRGVVDTRQLLFYLSGTVITLIFSILSVEAKLLHN